MNLDELLDHYRELMHLPDVTAVLAALGTVAADRITGDPVWTLLVGPPSSGKTEIIDSLRLVTGAVSISTVTKASLLSGRAGGAGGLLLTHFGEGSGILLVKDLTTILSEAAGARTEVLATLREIFDGHVTRAVGTRDNPLAWEGKLTFLGAVTEEIEQHRAVIGLMGDRFVYIPMPSNENNRTEIARRALTHGGKQRALRERLTEAVRAFFDQLPRTSEPAELTDPQIEWLCAAANLASQARSPVIRDHQRQRDIELTPEPELPARLVVEFGQLWHGLQTIGASDTQARGVITAASLGGIPKQRRAALLTLLTDGGSLRTIQVSARTRIPEPTVRRSLEDLAALRLIECDRGNQPGWNVNSWWPTQTSRALWAEITSSPQGSNEPTRGANPQSVPPGTERT